MTMTVVLMMVMMEEEEEGGRERKEDENSEIAWTEQLKDSISRFHIATTFFGNFLEYVIQTIR